VVAAKSEWGSVKGEGFRVQEFGYRGSEEGFKVRVKSEFRVLCARKCVPDSVHGNRENAVWEWNEARKRRQSAEHMGQSVGAGA
jgi:hypothetical protein